MAVKYPAIGNKVTAKIIEIGGKCSIGMQVGDDKDVMVWACPNSGNRVKVELRREKS